MLAHEALFEQDKNKKMTWGALQSLYIGGGTPSLWGERGADFLKYLFKENGLALRNKGEFTLEVNPGAWTSEGLEKWKEFGINRYSLGIQSLRKDYLKILDRIHSRDDVFKTLDFFQSKDLNFSVDFMLGLPWSHSKKRDILLELDEILSYGPKHISLYILTAKGGYLHKKNLPQDEYLEKEFLCVSERLRAEGFEHYEVSNFSKPGFSSQHNLRYWRCESVAALGPSAVGFLKEFSMRYKWEKGGQGFSKEVLTDDEKKIEKIYMGLRISEGLYPRDCFDRSVRKEVERQLFLWEEQGLGRGSWEHFSLNSRGFLILDTLIQKLFPYM